VADVISAVRGADILDAIERLGTLAGEIDNVMEAALRDTTEAVAADMSTGWPKGARPVKPARDHSKELWKSNQLTKLEWSVTNTAPYASFVYPKGKPSRPTIVEQHLERVIEENTADTMIGVSRRVLELLGEE